MRQNKLFKVLCFVLALVLVMMSSVANGDVEAKSTKSVSLKTLCSKRALTLKSMPSGSIHSIIKKYKGKKVTTHTIQNFSYTPDQKYIFTVGECNTGSQVHTLLTVSTIKKGFGDKCKSTCIDAKVLGKYGHGDAIAITEVAEKSEKASAEAGGVVEAEVAGDEAEVVCDEAEVTTEEATTEAGSEETTEAATEAATEESTEETAPKKSKDIYNVWVASAAGSNGFGTCIDRLTIEIKNNKMVIKKKVRIKNFKKANVIKGKAAFYAEKQDVKRMNVAADQSNNQIIFRIETSTEINYVAYDLKKLDKALDKVKNSGKYDIAKAAKMQLANVRCNVVPRSVFQSFRVHNNTIYICGGYFNNGAEINAVKYKVYKPGKSVEQDKKFSENVSRVIRLPDTIKIGKRSFKKQNVEVEGMDFVVNEKGKIDVHINYYARGVDIRDGITIFRFGL
ncbi:MAG: hypothetical protein J5517_10555 [Eubacterium sp.]|nr:hypothetical protein [Eubacterium sp.]